MSLSLLISSFTLFGQAKIGDEAPAFTLKNIDGKMISLSDYSNEKGVIVIFTCNHCPYAKLYEDRIIALNKKYAAKGWPVVAINPNDPEAQPEDSYKNMQKRAKQKKFTFPYLFDDGQKVYPAYGATRTPHVFLLHNVNGEFVIKYIGAIDDSPKNEADIEEKWLEDAISALNAGKTVSPSETKAIGCTIKVKS